MNYCNDVGIYDNFKSPSRRAMIAEPFSGTMQPISPFLSAIHVTAMNSGNADIFVHLTAAACDI